LPCNIYFTRIHTQSYIIYNSLHPGANIREGNKVLNTDIEFDLKNGIISFKVSNNGKYFVIANRRYFQIRDLVENKVIYEIPIPEP